MHSVVYKFAFYILIVTLTSGCFNIRVRSSDTRQIELEPNDTEISLDKEIAKAITALPEFTNIAPSIQVEVYQGRAIILVPEWDLAHLETLRTAIEQKYNLRTIRFIHQMSTSAQQVNNNRWLRLEAQIRINKLEGEVLRRLHIIGNSPDLIVLGRVTQAEKTDILCQLGAILSVHKVILYLDVEPSEPSQNECESTQIALDTEDGSEDQKQRNFRRP